MKETRMLMGMPITVDIADRHAETSDSEAVFDYFRSIDTRFSTYTPLSEISQINAGILSTDASSAEMREVLARAEATRLETDGYFDIRKPDGMLDPSGLVKGWAIEHAAHILERRGFRNFYIDAGGDIVVRGKNAAGAAWSIGIRDPFGSAAVVTIIHTTDCGIATSGTYLRGQHIYNPKDARPITDIVSLTVVGPTIYDADRFATAAFAMGKRGIMYIEHLDGFEGYQIASDGRAVMTTGFEAYIHP